MTGRTQFTDVLIRCRDGLIAVGAFSLVINLLALTGSLYMLQVYDRVLPGRGVDTLIYLTIIAGGALAAMGALALMRSRILVRLGTWIDRSLSSALLERGLENTLRGIPYRTEALFATSRPFAPILAVPVLGLCSTRRGCRSISCSSSFSTRYSASWRLLVL